MNIYTDISVDLAGRSMTQIVRAVKGDTGRILRIHIRNSGKPYLIDPDCYGVLMGKKPDGTSLYNACRIQDNAIEYPFTDQTCAREGSFPVQIRLYGPQKKLITTVPIQMDVYPTSFDAECAAASANEQTALDDLVSRTHALELDLLHDRETGAFLGESAYQIAVRLGFQGTEEAWLASLRYDHSEEFTRLAAQVRDHGREVQNAAQAAAIAAEAAAESQVRAGQSAMDAGKAAGDSAAQAAEAARQAGIAAEQAAEAGKQTGLASGAAETARAQAQTARTEAGRAKAEADKAARAALDAQTLLDDTQITDKKTTSSLKLYDTLCMPFEKSGQVVTCHPVPGYPLHVVSELPVVQEGSGDPSPDNVRPFVMQNHAKLVHSGVNLANHGLKPGTVIAGTGTIQFTINDDLSLSVKGTAGDNPSVFDFFQSDNNYRKSLCHALRGKTVHFSGCPSGGSNETYYMGFARGNDYNIVRDYGDGNTAKVEGKDGPWDFRIFFLVRENQTVDIRVPVQLEIGSVATPYEPYRVETFTAAFPEPVVGGKLDWKRGKLVKKWGMVTVDGSESGWAVEGTTFALSGKITNVKRESHNGYCDTFKYYFYGKGDGVYVGLDKLFIAEQLVAQYASLEDFLAQLQKTPMTVVYELNENQTIQATITDSPLGLPGENNLYSDTGNTTVSGRSDPICVVSDLISQVADLNEIVTNIPKP